MYQRVMREARDRVEVARRKENIRRQAKGMEELPPDTINLEICLLYTSDAADE